MRINKNAWHRKLLLDERSVPNDLCNYFWQVVAGIFVWAALLFSAVIVIFFVASALIYPFIYFGFNVPWIDAGKAESAFSVLLIVGAVIGLVLCCEKFRNRNREKQPNILSEFISAKKQKYCPRIEWLDND